MNHDQKIWILFPAFNEDNAIEQLLRDTYSLLTAEGYNRMELVVVDDGSTDRTAAIVGQLASSLPVKLLQHVKNQGLGMALRTGMMYMIQNSENQDIILTSEADGTQSVSKFIEIIKAVQNGIEIVVCSPMSGEGFKGVPLYRQLLSRGGNLIYEVLFPIPGVHDYTNLVRGFNASFLKKALEYYGESRFFDRSGFEAVPDVILKLRIFKPKILELTIQIDSSNKHKKSTMPVLSTIGNSLLLCARHLIGVRLDRV